MPPVGWPDPVEETGRPVSQAAEEAESQAHDGVTPQHTGDVHQPAYAHAFGQRERSPCPVAPFFSGHGLGVLVACLTMGVPITVMALGR